MASDTSPAPSPPERQKGISRKKKSASQTEVLERAYAGKCKAHEIPGTLFDFLEKYPSEATRAALGRELNLSNKQLQIWFTHRRYKDRRDGIDDEKLTFYAKNKTSADHISTLECRSSKKAEVETQAIEEDDGNDSEPDGYPARVLAEEQDDEELIAEHEHLNGMDVPYNGGYASLETLKLGPKRKSSARLLKDPIRPPRRPGPKPKVNAMAAAERAAISAVESQLCGPLRDDGPPLGFDFDPLPPRAFAELPIIEAPQTAGVSREGGSENFSERATLQSKWAKDLEVAEKKRRSIGVLKPSRGENGC